MTGPLFILTAAFFFACMNLGVRLLKDDFPPDVLIFYRSLFQVLALSYGIRAFLPRSRQDLKRKLMFHFARGLFGVTSMLFLYASMQRLPLATASLLTMSSVFWATLFSSLFLKESLSPRQAGWATITVIGMALALFQDDFSISFVADGFGVLSALLAGLSAGIAFTVLRTIRQTVSTQEIVFYFGCTGVLLTAPLSVLHFKIPNSPREVLLLIYVSVCATIAQIFMTQGFKDTTAALASVINLQQTTLSVLLGMVFLEEWPSRFFYMGAVLVFCALRNLILIQYKAV